MAATGQGRLADGSEYLIDSSGLRITRSDGQVAGSITLDEIEEIDVRGRLVTVTRSDGSSLTLEAASDDSAREINALLRSSAQPKPVPAAPPASPNAGPPSNPRRKTSTWLLGCAIVGAGLVGVFACVILVLVFALDFDIPGTAELSQEEAMLVEEALYMTLEEFGEINVEDEITIGLLLFHLRNDMPPPLIVVDEAIESAMLQEEIPGYRVSGYRNFWSSHVLDINWEAHPMHSGRIPTSYNNYLLNKRIARQEVINQNLAGIVASEQAWHNVMNDWNQWQSNTWTREQAARAEQDAWRTLNDSEAAIRAARIELDQYWSP